jgi:serine/threonine-protein kinase haspin
METRKPTTRTVAQRRVYGKRKNNAPRAVFDQKSPARETRKAVDATVEAVQSKLAEITINEEPVSAAQEVETSQNEEVAAEDLEEDSKIQHPNDPPSMTADFHSTPPSMDIPTEHPAEKISEMKRYEKLVEVRVSLEEADAPKTPKKAVPKPNNLSQEKRSTKKTSAGRRSSGFIHDPKINAYVRPILNESLSPIASQSIQRFGSWASKSTKMFHVAKLAEGSYGEVYKLHLREEGERPMVSKSKLAKLRAYGDGVFKVVPLNAPRGPGSKKFTSIEEIASEAKMLKYLDPIPGFARFREIHVVQGRFPETFQKAWDHYKETKNDCLNPDPSSKKSYADTQLWAIVEMDDAGCELEKFSWSSIFQIYDIFWGVTMALARAEEYAMFEVSFNTASESANSF